MRISDWSSDVCSSDLDDRRQFVLAGDWENDIADAPGWIVDRSAGNLDQESLLAIDPLDVFRDIAHHLAFRARSDLMDRPDQQVDHRIRKLSFPRHQINGIERSEEHTSELQSLMRISYAVFCLKNNIGIVNMEYTRINILPLRSQVVNLIQFLIL